MTSHLHDPATDAGDSDDRATRLITDGQSSAMRVIDGDVWAFLAFDIGYAIDLDAAERIARTGAGAREVSRGRASEPGADQEQTTREQLRHRRRSVSSPQFRPAPLRIDQPAPELREVDIGGFRPAPRVECTLHEFGAVSVAYRIPIDRGPDGLPLHAILPLTQAIMEGRALGEDAWRRITALAERLRPAIDRAAVSELVEDYAVVHVRRWHGMQDAMAAVASEAATVARVLMAEPGPLSAHAVATATAARVSYAPDDVAVIDWSGALLLGPDEEDAITVLEFANVELLEMRFLDDRLDAVLDRAYHSLLRRDRRGRPRRSPLGLLVDPHRAERRWLADLQMESAVLFENANNTLKLVGDQHLARLYATAAQRLHISDWDQSILRKLDTVEGLYQKLADEHAARRMEFLEWIIIILIAISTILPFIPGVKY